MHNRYPRRHNTETIATYAALAFLAGLIAGLAACTPNEPPCQPTTEQQWNG
jgi:hypothetical protein